MAKGPQFERDICRQLSLWWTGGKDDAVFWRTHGSGARATTRMKAGKRTAGQFGDIAASDPIGAPLIQKITFSLKRGYKRHSLHDLLDKPANAKPQEWEKWISEIRKTARDAGTPFWAIIAKRDRREPIIVLPKKIVRAFCLDPSATIFSSVVVPFREFLEYTKPAEILSHD